MSNNAWAAYKNGLIPRMAKAIREQEAWYDLPVLADAMEEAGYPDERDVDHFRERNEYTHWRYCVYLLVLTYGMTHEQWVLGEWEKVQEIQNTVTSLSPEE